MKKYLLFFIAAALGSCSVLSESQIKNINAFGATAKSYTYFPSAVFKQKAELRFDEALLKTTQMPTAALIKENVANAQSAYNTALQLSDKFDLSLQLIQQYAGLLEKLSSGSYVESLGANTAQLGENLTGLVDIYNGKMPNSPLPAGLGAALSRAVFLAGERLTRTRQAKELKTFIPQGDRLIQATVKNLVAVFETDTPSVKQLLQGDREAFINSYTNIILSNANKVDYSSIRRYADALADYEMLEAMRRACVAAAQELAAAHAVLAANIRKKAELKEIFTETQRLISSVQELQKLFGALRTGSQPTT